MLSVHLTAVTFLFILVPAAAGEDSANWDFEDAKVGELPVGWVAAKTGTGAGSVWKVVELEEGGKKTHALAQTSSEGDDAQFNLCVAAKERYADVDLSVMVKAIRGTNDQGGGLVWRYVDGNNYYITRWNPLEDNFRVYHVLKGKRTQLATADVKVDPAKWHTVRAVQVGSKIRCYLDDKLLLEAADETFQDAGLIGFWSKADAVSSFDNLQVKTPSKEAKAKE